MDISTRALTKVYGSRTVLAGINLHIPTASQVAFTGPSGVGKTTLLYLLSGIIAPSSGEIYLGSSRLNDYSRRDLQALRRQKFGFVFQSEQLVDQLSVRENVALPLLLKRIGRAEAMSRTQRELEKLGLETIASQISGNLSAALRQKVALARALVGKPEIIIADQPTDRLDEVTAQETMQVLSTTAQQTRATLLVTSLNSQDTSWCERTITLRDGLIVSDRTKTALPENPGEN